MIRFAVIRDADMRTEPDRHSGIPLFATAGALIARIEREEDVGAAECIVLRGG